LGVRKAIITHFQEGMSYRDIVHHLRAFDVTKNHVEYTIKKFKESNNVDESILDKPRSGRPRSKRSPQIIRSVGAKIERNPNKPIRKMAREAGMDPMVMWRIVRDDLKYKSYKLRRRTYLTDKTMEKRLLRGRAILRILKSR
jgi:transposase